MDDFLISQTNDLLRRFQTSQEYSKELQNLTKTLTGSSKPSSSKV
jgi:hypothetical protein